MQISIILFSGIPGAGKTTLLNQLQNDPKLYECISVLSQENCIENSTISNFLISYDNFIDQDLEYEIFEEKKRGTWKSCRQYLLTLVDKHIKCLLSGEKFVPDDNTEIPPDLFQKYQRTVFKDNIDANNQIIFFVEDNFYYRGMRYSYFQMAKKNNIGFCQIHLHCSLNLAIQRNCERKNGVEESVIVRMADKIEPPNSEENSWEKLSLIINTDTIVSINQSMQSLYNLIAESLINPLESLSEEQLAASQFSREINDKNMIHNADKHLRKLIGGYVQKAKKKSTQKTSIKEISKHLNEVKSKTLQSLRTEVQEVNISFLDKLFHSKVASNVFLKDFF